MFIKRTKYVYRFMWKIKSSKSSLQSYLWLWLGLTKYNLQNISKFFLLNLPIKQMLLVPCERKNYKPTDLWISPCFGFQVNGRITNPQICGLVTFLAVLFLKYKRRDSNPCCVSLGMSCKLSVYVKQFGTKTGVQWNSVSALISFIIDVIISITITP